MSEANHCRSGVYCLLHDCACPCDGCLPHSDPEAHENRATIARLTRERDEARAAYASASREWAERHEHARERILGLTGERDAARRELHRLTHGEAIEGDGMCRHEIDAQAARAWSRLWHREARRLWREVQALGAMLDDVQREVEPEQWLRDVGGDQ